MPEIDLYLKQPNAEKKTAVCISMYCQDGRVRKAIPQAKIHPDFWDGPNKWFEKDPKNKGLNASKSKVENVVGKIKKHLSHCEHFSLPVLKKDIENIIKAPKIVQPKKGGKTDLLVLYQKLIDLAAEGKIKVPEKETNYTAGTLKIWKLNKSLLTTFAEKTGTVLDAQTITIEQVETFKAWMNTRAKASLNYVSLHVGLWRSNMEIMHRLGWHHNEIIKTEQFAGAFEKVAKMKVDEEDVIKLFNFDLSDKPYLQAVRDRWVLMYCTGLRVSDNARLTLDHFGKDFISLVNQKTGKKVVIPYHWMVRKILSRYNGNLPRCIIDKIMNKKIKQIAKDSGLFNQRFTYKITRKGVRLEETKFHWELFINHTARRSMASNLIRNLVPWEAGGDMMGMSPSTWKRYNSLTPEDKAAALKKLDMFKG